MIGGNPEGYKPGSYYNLYLLGSRDYTQLQQFTHFVITAEAVTKDNRITFGGPKRVGRFMLFSDSLTKFSDRCVNTVVEADDLPKSEVQAMWVAPADGSGCVRLSAMVYENKDSWFADDGQLTKTICQEKPTAKKINDDECCACDEAKYNFIFEGIWSNETHPKDYPFAVWLTHFSDIIGASHEPSFSFWGEGHLASDGFRSLAEWGSPRLLENELRARGGRLKTLIKAGGLWFPHVNTNTSSNFKVDRKHNKVSLVSMFGPSPDWVVGVSGLDLCRKDCTWEESLDIDLTPWDAGTDSGISYMSPNEATLPQEKMYKITTKYPEDPRAPFYNAFSDEMTPLAKLYIRRTKVIPRNCDDEILKSQILDVAENEDEPDRPECDVTEYSSWSPCSVTCGKGLRQRTRSYKNPDIAQASGCQRQLIFKEMCVATIPECENGESEADSSESLIVPDSTIGDDGEGTGVCATTHWSMWSECSVTCGIGITMRTRTFKNARGRKQCTHIPTVEKQKCMQPECQITDIEAPDHECPVTPWSDWSPCSASCGRGVQIRTRLLLVEPHKEEMCRKRLELNQQKMCEVRQQCLFNPEETRDICNSEVDSGQCRGSYMRYYYNVHTQSCAPFEYGGCRGNQNNFLTVEDCLRACSTVRTPDPARIQPTTQRTVTRTSSPVQTNEPRREQQVRTQQQARTRFESSFDREQPQNTYRQSRVQNQPIQPVRQPQPQPQPQPETVTENNLPVDCVLSEWTEWSPCTATCGYGRQEKIRKVIRESENGGLPCPTKLVKRRRCSLAPCNLSINFRS
jgi:hypothetical protein